MEKYIKPKFNSEQGSSLLVVLILVALISVGAATLLWLREQNLRMTYVGQRSTLTLSLARSAIDTFFVAWKNLESNYYGHLTACDGVNGFIPALSLGHGCGAAPFTMFTGGTADPLAGTYTYTYNPMSLGCAIAGNTSNCTAFRTPFLRMGFGNPRQTESLSNYNFEFSLLHVLPNSHLAEFRLLMTSPEGAVTRYDFVIRDSLQSVIHLESSGRLSQEKGDPFAVCPNRTWGPFQTFDLTTQACHVFNNAAAGIGLVAYKERFFGFRPDTGQVVDLLSLDDPSASPASYMVAPDGTVPGLGAVFVEYPNPADVNISLRNADDITLIDDQIYYVRGQGASTELRGMIKGVGGAWVDQLICPLGAQGWAQSVVGLAALSYSDPLLRVPGNFLSDSMVNRTAIFYVKTDNGDMLTARVSSPDAATFNCQTYKDKSLQQVEYKRTLGFEASSTQAKYYIY